MTFLTRYNYNPALANGQLASIDRVLDTLFGDTLARQSATDTARFSVDVLEDGDAYVVHAELPGFKKEQIHVEIDGAVVSITAEWKQSKDTQEGAPTAKVLRSERRSWQTEGKIARSFQLPVEVDAAAATAKMTDGILELRLPKQTQATSKRLTVQ
jgi:HSP20 family protein